MFELFNKACFGEHTLGQSILGAGNRILFPQADLAGFMSRFYSGNQMIICAAGQLIMTGLPAGS